MPSEQLLLDEDAIQYLARQVGTSDQSASSHWRQELETFRYEDGDFQGVRGLGHHAAPATGLRRFYHQTLQRRFRRMGEGFPEFPAIDRLAAEITARQGRLYELGVLRQALTLALLRAQAPECLASGRVVLVIGDGYGTLASLLLAHNPGLRVMAINLSQSLLVDLVYIQSALSGASVGLATSRDALHGALEADGPRLLAVRADDMDFLAGVPISLAVNIASMQEMEPAVIDAYFRLLRASSAEPTLFYCCNREEKQLPDGTVVRFADYPWRPGDAALIDAPCPWHAHYYQPIPPFYRPYLGTVRHWLGQLEKAPAG